MKRPASLKGFTLIELLIVIVIIGILSAGAFALFTGSQAKARDAIRKNDVKAIETAVMLYMNDKSDVTPNAYNVKGTYSATATDVDCSATVSTCQNGLVGKYLQKAIAEPKTGEKYAFCENGTQFTIATLLEDGRAPTPALTSVFTAGPGAISAFTTATTDFLSTVPVSSTGTCVLIP